MRSRTGPTIALCVSISLFLQMMGCSASDPCIKHKVKGDAPREYYVTYDSIQCIGKGKEVTLRLKDQTVLRGTYWGIDDGRMPLRLYVILPEHLTQVRDSLKEWVPAASEWIIAYGYPSGSVLFEGHSDDAMWLDMMNDAKQKLHYMTPKLLPGRIVAAKISSGSAMQRVPVDSIAQVVRRETVSSDREPEEQVAVGIVFVAGAVAIAYAVSLIAWVSSGGKIM